MRAPLLFLRDRGNLVAYRIMPEAVITGITGPQVICPVCPVVVEKPLRNRRLPLVRKFPLAVALAVYKLHPAILAPETKKPLVLLQQLVAAITHGCRQLGTRRRRIIDSLVLVGATVGGGRWCVDGQAPQGACVCSCGCGCIYPGHNVKAAAACAAAPAIVGAVQEVRRRE